MLGLPLVDPFGTVLKQAGELQEHLQRMRELTPPKDPRTQAIENLLKKTMPKELFKHDEPTMTLESQAIRAEAAKRLFMRMYPVKFAVGKRMRRRHFRQWSRYGKVCTRPHHLCHRNAWRHMI